MPYRDIFFDVNPPLMLYLTVPAVLAARLTGVFVVDAYFLYVFAVVALSLVFAWFGGGGAPESHEPCSSCWRCR